MKWLKREWQRYGRNRVRINQISNRILGCWLMLPIACYISFIYHLRSIGKISHTKRYWLSKDFHKTFGLSVQWPMEE